MSNKPIYSPVPARVMGAENLTSLDLRVLMAIGFHDRLGANGTGCVASPNRLAQLTGCHTKSLLRSVGILKAHGIIDIQPFPLDRRRHVYKVVYTPFDAEYAKGNGNKGSYQSPGKIGNRDRACDGNSVTENRQIGNRDFENVEQDQSLAEGNILEEKKEINISREAGPEGPKSPGVSAMLSMIERIQESGRGLISTHLDYLRDIAAHDTAQGRHAQRLLKRDGEF